MGRGSRHSFGSKRGSSVVEVGLLLPWIVISFIAVLDFGFCAYGLIATQDAARVGAMWGSADMTVAPGIATATQPCTYAVKELQYAPNVGSAVTTCTGTSPIRVTASYLTGASSPDKQNPAVSVAVTYTVTLLPIPGLMPSSLSITRTVQQLVRNP